MSPRKLLGTPVLVPFPPRARSGNAVARIECVITICDLHDGEADGRRALFVMDRRIYTIDACPAHTAELRAAVALVERARAAYISTAAQRVGVRPRRRGVRTESHSKLRTAQG